MPHLHRLIPSVAIGLFPAAVLAAPPSYTLTPILVGQNSGNQVDAPSINDAGQVAIEIYGPSPLQGVPLRLNPDGSLVQCMPVGGYVDVILADGRVICDFNSPQGYLGFTVGDEHGYTTLAYPAGFPITGMAANAATANGTIVGGANGYVVTWSGPDMTPSVLGRINGQNTTAISASRNGKYLVGVSGTDDQAEAFVYSNGIFTTITVPGFAYVEASGVNNAGTVIGYAIDGASNTRVAWEWRDGRLTYLPGLPGDTIVSPASINDNGLIVGTDGLHALLWDADGTAYSLDDLSNAAAMEDGVGYAYSINDSNQIIGAGGGNAYPGETVPFLLNPIVVPEPASAEILLPAILLFRRRAD